MSESVDRELFEFFRGEILNLKNDLSKRIPLYPKIINSIAGLEDTLVAMMYAAMKLGSLDIEMVYTSPWALMQVYCVETIGYRTGLDSKILWEPIVRFRDSITRKIASILEEANEVYRQEELRRSMAGNPRGVESSDSDQKDSSSR